MRNKAEIEQNIIQVSMKIISDYPELVKYLPEMPEHNKAVSGYKMSEYHLSEYLNSLEEVVKRYAKTHEIRNEVPEN